MSEASRYCGKDRSRGGPAKATKPKSARRWAREFAVQALYELFVAGHEVAAVRPAH